jgi:DNA-directed RNA polymerase specialized sigma24 family protein
MDERAWLTARFEQHRPHLRAVAYRMLGSVSTNASLDPRAARHLLFVHSASGTSA